MNEGTSSGLIFSCRADLVLIYPSISRSLQAVGRLTGMWNPASSFSTTNRTVGRLPSEVQAAVAAGVNPSKPLQLKRVPEVTPSQSIPKEQQLVITKDRIAELAKAGVFAKAADAMSAQASNEEFVEEVMEMLVGAISVEGQTVTTIGLNQNSLHALQTAVRR